VKRSKGRAHRDVEESKNGSSEAVYSLFGFYVIGATYASFYTIPEKMILLYQGLYDLLCRAG
jgi:hypothetical protein